MQRIADLLVRDGLAVYTDNPDHLRAKLLSPTTAGRRALITINKAQAAWADKLGAAIAEADLRRITAMIENVGQLTSGGAE